MKGGLKKRKMKLNIKKISAVLTSGLMFGLTLGVAAAASMPAPFSSSTASGVAIVTGTGSGVDDTVAAQSINTYLATKVKATTSTPTGESVLFEKSSTKFQLGNGVVDVVATAVTDSNPNGGLPTLLADGKYIDDDNDEFDYTQSIDMANLSLVMFDDSDYAEDAPTIGFKISSGANVLNYTLDFTDEPLWADLTTTDLKLMGKEYYVLSYINGTTLNLLDAASATTLEQGESTTLLVDGVSYEIICDFVGSSNARFTVNGETTNSLAAGETQKVSGAYIGIKSIDSQQYAEGLKQVQFAIGTGKLKLVGESDVELNDNTITGLSANFTIGSEKLKKIRLIWDADDDLFITPDSEISMPGFEAIKLSYTGMEYPAEEVIKVEGGSTYVTLKNFPLKSGATDISILYGNNSVWNGIGKDSDNILRTSNNSLMTFDGDTDDYFVASYNDGSNAESYLVKADSFKIEDAVNKTDFTYRTGATWTTVASEAVDGEVVTIGNVEFTVGTIEKAQKTVNITAGTNVNFHELYSAEGMQIYLPYFNESDSFLAGSKGVINSSAKTSTGGNPTTFSLVFDEEDKNENIGSGETFNATLGWDSSSTPEAEVSDVVDETVTFEEIGTTDVYRSFIYSALATELLWNKPSGSQKSLDVMYHGAESYGKFYITASDAVSSSAGSMIFKDNEKSSWETRDVVLVGGSCINSATAEALGVPENTCEAAFTAATSVGEGQYLIESVEGFMTGKIALVVAGYSEADTAAAASKLVNQPESIDTAVGNKYIGIVGVGTESTLSKQ